MFGPTMVMFDKNGDGQAIIDGQSYRVTGKHSETYRWDERNRKVLEFKLTLEASLDEEAQQRRIKGLEGELERERERLDEIRTALSADQ
jgi:hypothetical protein